MRIIPVTTLSLLLVCAAPAAAQTQTELLACAVIARDADRLACFDAAVATSSAEARAASQKRVAESARIAAEEAVVAAAAAKTKAAADAIAAARPGWLSGRDSSGLSGIASRAGVNSAMQGCPAKRLL